MAKSIPNLYPIELTAEQRHRFTDITRNGRAPAKKFRHAMVLLLSDRNRPEGHLTREEISKQLGMHVNTIDRIRKRFVLEGEAPALDRKKRQTPPTPPKFDGHAEAQLVALCCSPPPSGRAKWSLRLLVKEATKRKIVTSVCVETVRKTLKKTSCSLGESNVGAFPSGTRHASSHKWKRSSTNTRSRLRTTSR
jgi:hypothetical protein